MNDLSYIVNEGNIILKFEYFQSDLIEDGSVVDLILSWDKNLICIELRLLELDENNQYILDASILSMLLNENSNMFFSKFCLDRHGISIVVDIDAYNLDFSEISSGFKAILDGFERYYNILSIWYRVLLQEENFMYNDIIECNDIYELAEPSSKRGVILRTLCDIGKIGLKAGALTGIAAIAGVPSAGIATILAGIAATSFGSNKNRNEA
jgi:hypothetical protein